MTLNMTAEQAIDQSIFQNEIVHIAYDLGTAEDLIVECDDHVRNSAEEEYWGTRDGSEWRVHMRLKPGE